MNPLNNVNGGFDAVLLCPQCGHSVKLSADGMCNCKTSNYALKDGIFRPRTLPESAEMVTRDSQAVGYLKHGKFPTQIQSVRRWLGGQSESSTALDLGSGPGPYTQILSERGNYVIAIDFSIKSLRVNRTQQPSVSRAAFVQQDLNTIVLQRNSVEILLMADFLQHLGGREQRRRLLAQALGALRPGGRFYLSFFNLNVKHFLRGDVHGGFSNNTIEYERLTTPNVLSDLPRDLRINGVYPMNIFHSAGVDQLACRLRIVARYLARMTFITGEKR